MAKPVTTWTNNDVKPSGGWTKAAKNSSQWTNNIAKAAATFTLASRNSSQWNLITPQVPYTYDSATLTYDSAIYSYDYTTSEMNQLNKKSTTAWSAA